MSCCLVDNLCVGGRLLSNVSDVCLSIEIGQINAQCGDSPASTDRCCIQEKLIDSANCVVVVSTVDAMHLQSPKIYQFLQIESSSIIQTCHAYLISPADAEITQQPMLRCWRCAMSISCDAVNIVTDAVQFALLE